MPIADKFDNASIAIVQVSIANKIPYDIALLALHDIFCVSIHCVHKEFFDPCSKLDDISGQHLVEKITGFRGDEYIVLSPYAVAPCADFSTVAMHKLKEYLSYIIRYNF